MLSPLLQHFPHIFPWLVPSHSSGLSSGSYPKDVLPDYPAVALLPHHPPFQAILFSLYCLSCSQTHLIILYVCSVSTLPLLSVGSRRAGERVFLSPVVPPAQQRVRHRACTLHVLLDGSLRLVTCKQTPNAQTQMPHKPHRHAHASCAHGWAHTCA